MRTGRGNGRKHKELAGKLMAGKWKPGKIQGEILRQKDFNAEDTARQNRNQKTESWPDRIMFGRSIRAESWEEEDLRCRQRKSCSNCAIFRDSTAKRRGETRSCGAFAQKPS